MKKWMNGLMALVAFFSFGMLSTIAFAGDDEKEKKMDKGGQVVLLGDEKKDEKKDKDKGGQVVVFGDEKKDEKKDKGGK